MMRLLILALILLSFKSWARSPDICDLIDLPGCHGVTKQVRRSSAVSLPSPATSANVNPATVSFDRGLGLEVIHQPGNPANFNIASGSGKFGGALISHGLENSFFSNRVPEIEEDFLKRQIEDKQYRQEKLNLALGGKLLRKKHFALDAGLLFKRHAEIKKINPGAGLAGRLGPVTFGASVYRDDFRLKLADHLDPYTGVPYSFTFGTETYTETFSVQTYTMGTRLGPLSVDAGLILTDYDFYDEPTKINLYSMALNYRNFLFNLGIRRENSKAQKFEDDRLVIERRKNETYWGVQASVGKHLILGLQHNYFLLRELSFMATLFY